MTNGKETKSYLTLSDKDYRRHKFSEVLQKGVAEENLTLRKKIDDLQGSHETLSRHIQLIENYNHDLRFMLAKFGKLGVDERLVIDGNLVIEKESRERAGAEWSDSHLDFMQKLLPGNVKAIVAPRPLTDVDRNKCVERPPAEHCTPRLTRVRRAKQ
jgi:hypothetical protein